MFLFRPRQQSARGPRPRPFHQSCQTRWWPVPTTWFGCLSLTGVLPPLWRAATRTMAPAFLKSLRRRSRASFRTDRSTDDSSEGAFSNGTGPSSGLVTPASTAHQSDPALDLQVSKEPAPSSQNAHSPVPRPPLAPVANTKRHSSSSGMSGLGAPSVRGRSNLPLSPYAPMILNVSENAWVCRMLCHGREPKSGVLCADSRLGLSENASRPRLDR